MEAWKEEGILSLKKTVSADFTGQNSQAYVNPKQRATTRQVPIFECFDMDDDDILQEVIRDIEENIFSLDDLDDVLFSEDIDLEGTIQDLFRETNVETDANSKGEIGPIQNTFEMNIETGAGDNKHTDDIEESTQLKDDNQKAALLLCLNSLKTTSETLCMKWLNESYDTFKTRFINATAIKAFNVAELKVMVKALKTLNFNFDKQLHYKADYVNFFSSTFGDNSKIETRSYTTKGCNTIKSVLMKMKKTTLNAILCSLIWPGKIQEWNNRNIFQNGEVIDGLQKILWQSQPEIDDDGKPLLTFLDFHHLFTNTRCHVGRKGYPRAGITREAWVKVARCEKSNQTGLNIAFVDDGVDAQSDAVAQLFFSESVEFEMRRNGDTTEAEFCKLIRLWHNALDERGMAVSERTRHVLNMRYWLLLQLLPHMIVFPPVMSYVNDIPLGNFQGLLLSTERYLQLFALVNEGCFNVRSLGSQQNETFFGSFRDLDPQGAGVLKPDELPRAMSVACQLLEARLDPDK